MEDERQRTNRLPALPRLSKNINTLLSSQFLSVLFAAVERKHGTHFKASVMYNFYTAIVLLNIHKDNIAILFV